MMLSIVDGVLAAQECSRGVFGDEGLDFSFLMDGVLAASDASQSYELTVIVSRTLGLIVDAESCKKVAQEEVALTRALGLSGRRTRTLEQYLEGALVGATRSQLGRGHKLMEHYRASVGIKKRVCEASAAAMAATERKTLEEAKALLHGQGIDAERLCWAVVAVEARRHVPLLLKEANRAAADWTDRGADSLIGYAWQGLRLALYNYDPERGMFSTYACPRIRGAIRDGIRQESHLPKRLTTFIRKVDKAKEVLTHRLGRHPDLEEVAKSLDLELAKLGSLRHLGAPVSLNDLVERNDSFAVVSDEDPEERAIEGARREAIAAALEAIDPDDALVVRLMVLEGVSVGECQTRTGMSARQLRQRKEHGLGELETLLMEWAY
jgi:RNA polymerase sigma factor for flagellar operon FliA